MDHKRLKFCSILLNWCFKNFVFLTLFQWGWFPMMGNKRHMKYQWPSKKTWCNTTWSVSIWFLKLASWSSVLQLRPPLFQKGHTKGPITLYIPVSHSTCAVVVSFDDPLLNCSYYINEAAVRVETVMPLEGFGLYSKWQCQSMISDF